MNQNKFLSVIAFLCAIGIYQNEAIADPNPMAFLVVTEVKFDPGNYRDSTCIHVTGEVIVGDTTSEMTRKLCFTEIGEHAECNKLALMALARPGRYMFIIRDDDNIYDRTTCSLRLVQN